MKLSVSNISWDNNELDAHLKLLRDLGCEGVDIAPSCVWPEPVHIEQEEMKRFKRLIEKYHLAIASFHALLYTRPDLYLFGDETARGEAVSYLKKLIRLAGELSVKTLIYGSPKSRKIGDQDRAKCYSRAVEIFRELAKEAKRHDTCLCIEPLGPSESDFINVADEAYRLVEDVDSAGFGLHLDAKAMVETKEDFHRVFQRYGGLLKHFHVSEPGLAPPGHSGFDHSIIGRELCACGYPGFVAIEMRKGFGETKEVIKNAVHYTRQRYFSHHEK
ncbi:MAG: sugar phosphate isomerase/epimerase [Candidatus Omnitrophota bacterium]